MRILICVLVISFEGLYPKVYTENLERITQEI